MNNFFIPNNNDVIDVNEDFLGYVVFFAKSKDGSIAEIQMNLLHKLIENALKLKMDNFLFIDLNEQKIRLSALRKLFKIEKCFLFGMSENEIGANIIVPNYQLTKVAAIEFLKVDALEKVEQNKDMKNKLWTQLQISFKLS